MRKWYARKEEIFSKVCAGRRTYFFDVRATKADDYYITGEQKIHWRRRIVSLQKHIKYIYTKKIFCFQKFWYDCLCFKPQRREVISERHQKDFKRI
jgi:hypothetical protein